MALLTGCMASQPPTVPAEHRKLIRKAAGRCRGLDAGTVAAQLYVESKFDPQARSRVGARGIAQFMPDTWSTWGRDENGDGVASPLQPEDAIPAQVRLMCHLMARAQASGVPGDRLTLALAAYNAGWSAVEQARGVPDYPETVAYVEKIRDLAPRYRLRSRPDPRVTRQ